MSGQPAIIFTHFPSLKHGEDIAVERHGLLTYFEPILEAYCTTNDDKVRIGVVYIYIDEFVQKRLKAGSEVSGTSLALFHAREDALKNILKEMVDGIRSDHPDLTLPRFEFIGLREVSPRYCQVNERDDPKVEMRDTFTS